MPFPDPAQGVQVAHRENPINGSWEVSHLSHELADLIHQPLEMMHKLAIFFLGVTMTSAIRIPSIPTPAAAASALALSPLVAAPAFADVVHQATVASKASRLDAKLTWQARSAAADPRHALCPRS